MGVKDYSTNPDNNGVVAGVPYFPPNMLANALDDACRRVMADLASFIAGYFGYKLTSASVIQDRNTNPVDRAVGYLTLPSSPQKTAAYTIAPVDVAHRVPISSGGITIPANATTAFALDDLIVIHNNGTVSQPIAPASGVTLTLAGSATTGARQLNPNGLATLLQVDKTDNWLIYGLGIA